MLAATAHSTTISTAIRIQSQPTHHLLLLEAGLSKAGITVYQAGRLVSFSALLGIFALTWRLLLLYTGNRNCAWTGTVLCTSTSLLTSWGTGRANRHARIFFAVAAFYQYSRYAIEGRDSLVLAGVFVIAAFSQSRRRSPVQPRSSCSFGSNAQSWRFSLAPQSEASWPPSRWRSTPLWADVSCRHSAREHESIRFREVSLSILDTRAVAAGQMVIVAVVGAKQAWRGHGRALFIYLGMAMAVLAVTAPKIGSDSNYQIESTILLILCACMALHSLNFFALLFGGSKTWITLLQIPLMMHVVLIIGSRRLGSWEPFPRSSSFALKLPPWGRTWRTAAGVISTALNAMIKFRGRDRGRATHLQAAGGVGSGRSRNPYAATLPPPRVFLLHHHSCLRT